MSQAITASYHLPKAVKGYIDKESKDLGLSKGVFLAFLIENYQKVKLENTNLKAYFSMATDHEFLADQVAESEADFVSELSFNKDFSV